MKIKKKKKDFLITHESKQKSQKKLRYIFNLNKKKNKSYLNMRHAVKTLGRTVIALNAYLGRLRGSKMNNGSFHLWKLGKEEQLEPEATRTKSHKNES